MIITNDALQQLPPECSVVVSVLGPGSARVFSAPLDSGSESVQTTAKFHRRINKQTEQIYIHH